jgi:hypothetical protein
MSGCKKPYVLELLEKDYRVCYWVQHVRYGSDIGARRGVQSSVNQGLQGGKTAVTILNLRWFREQQAPIEGCDEW